MIYLNTLTWFVLDIVRKVFNLGVWEMIIFHEPNKVLGANSGGIGNQVIHLRPFIQELKIRFRSKVSLCLYFVSFEMLSIWESGK